MMKLENLLPYYEKSYEKLVKLGILKMHVKLGGFYLGINYLTVLVLSGDSIIEKNLIEIFKENKEKAHIITVNSLLALTVNDINPDIIIMDEGSFDLQRERINFIKSKNSLGTYEVIGVLKLSNVDEFNKLTELGVKEVIFQPYTIEEIYVRVKSLSQYISMKNECKLKAMQLKALMNNIPYMTWIKDEESRYIHVNKKFEKICGKSEEVIEGQTDAFVWGSKLNNKHKDEDVKVMEIGKQLISEIAVPDTDGKTQLCIYKSPVIDENGRVSGTIGIASDITEVKHMEAELDIIIENIPFGVCVKDVNGKIINLNKQLLEYYDIKKQDIIGNDGREVLSKECYDLFKEEDNEVIEGKCGKIFERKVKIKDKYRIMEVHKEPIIDNFQRVIGIVVLIRDVTKLMQYQEKIERLAYTDQLTGLDNRRSLYEHINNGDKDSEKCLTILLVDLDNFKRLNDSLGHWYGDEALVKISQRIKVACGDAFVARTGGDEFVIIFEGVLSEENLMRKISEVLKATNVEFVYEDKINLVSASIGVVRSCTRNQDIEKILTKGFLALYKAKEQGKNQYIMYTEELEAERKFNQEIETALRESINNEEVKVYFQPQYGKDKISGDNVLVGFEALFRWNNDKYKHMPVIDVIRTIERLNIIDVIEEYIMVESFKFAKKINENRMEKIIVSINVSALQIMESNFVDKVKNIIDEVGVDPETIGVEITETVLLENLDENIYKINALKNLGMKVALDDFGTGYSSLSYLVKLPLSHVKIDKSFISNMSNGFEYIKLIGLITEATHSLGLKVVAEGVEKYDELIILEGMGIDFIQGYLYSKPLPKAEAEQLAFKSK